MTKNIEASISAAASALGKRGRGVPKNYSEEERELRRERIKRARAIKAQKLMARDKRVREQLEEDAT